MSHSNTSDHHVNKNINQPTSEGTLSEIQQTFLLFDSLNERPIAFNPVYAKITKCIKAGLLLSQILYWYKTMNYRQFYKTDEEFCEEIGRGAMGIKAFRAAKAKLEKLGFIAIEVKSMPAKSYYRVNIKLIISCLVASGKAPEPISKPKVGTPVCLKEANQYAYNRQATSETTTETTSNNNSISRLRPITPLGPVTPVIEKTIIDETTDEPQIRRRLAAMKKAGEVPGPINRRSLDQLHREVAYYIDNRDKILIPTFKHALNAAIKLIKAGEWTTPHNLALEESKVREETARQEKLQEIKQSKGSPILTAYFSANAANGIAEAKAAIQQIRLKAQ